MVPYAHVLFIWHFCNQVNRLYGFKERIETIGINFYTLDKKCKVSLEFLLFLILEKNASKAFETSNIDLINNIAEFP